MSPGLLISLSLLLASNAHAHRTDEYLQDTTFLLEQRQLTAWIRLTPGSDLLPQILPQIDTNSDGVISPAEQSAYAQKVLKDFTLVADGRSLMPRLASASFPKIDDMKEGLGEIVLVITAPLPEAGAPTRRLNFENRHQPRFGAYIVNALIPDDPNIHIQTQSRSFNQSHYELTYTQPLPATSVRPFPYSTTAIASKGALALMFLALCTPLLHKRRFRKAAPAVASSVNP